MTLQKTHRTASARHGFSSRTVLAEGLEPFGFLAQHEGKPRVLYLAEGAGVAGAGVAGELVASGPDRFDALRRESEAWRTQLAHERGPDVPDAVGPRWVGGLAFEADANEADFPAARFVLPRVQLTIHEGQSYLTTTGPASAAPAPSTTPLRTGPRLDGLVWRNEPGFEAWATAVRSALDAIRNGTVAKVVLSRSLAAKLPQPARLARILRALATRSPASRTFLVEPRPGAAFLGSSPELLVARFQGRLRTVAIAGSRARGRTAEEDEALARNLAASSKEAWEHELVARFIRSVLGRRPYPWSSLVERRILKLPNVQHLETQFDGPSGPEESLLGLARDLHPTPAVGGSPPEAALRLLGTLEARSRGWYGGPVGWFDMEGDGELAVGIRSAVVRGREVQLAAGCGIVEGSDPAEEWAESRLKFQLLMDAFDAEASA